MATNDERREVARRLREYVDIPDDWWADTYSGFYVEKCVFGDVERHRESELFARLADLIDPEPERTCRDVGPGGMFVCSECGASLDYEGWHDEPTYWVDGVAAAVEYCPNCRAKVIYGG